MWRTARILLAFACLVTGVAKAFTIDTAPTAISNVSGLWWNSSESGWGANIAHQGGVMFVTVFTYDGVGNPTWYVASNCAVSGSQCSGTLYRVAGGRPLVQSWGGVSVSATPVGNITISFSDLSNANVSMAVDGISTTKVMTRQIFGNVQAPTTSDPNRTKTEQLIGGTWTFAYTIISNFTNSYSFTSVRPNTAVAGDWSADGKNAFGGLVVGTYASKNAVWTVLEPGTIIDRFYIFTFGDLNHVSGCYYQVNPPGSTNLSSCYGMSGSRFPGKSLTWADPLELEQMEVDAAKAAPHAGPPAPPEAYEMLQQLRSMAKER